MGDGLGGGETQKTDLDEEYEDVEGLDWDKTQVRISYVLLPLVVLDSLICVCDIRLRHSLKEWSA